MPSPQTDVLVQKVGSFAATLRTTGLGSLVCRPDLTQGVIAGWGMLAGLQPQALTENRGAGILPPARLTCNSVSEV